MILVFSTGVDKLVAAGHDIGIQHRDGQTSRQQNGIVQNEVKFVKVNVKPSLYRPGRPCKFQEVEVPIFFENGHMKVVRSALRTGRLYPAGNILISVRD
jgi:hypothetical protein